MANALYPKGNEKILSAAINFASDTIKAVVVTNAYTYSAAHELLSDLGAALVGTAQELTNKSVANGAFDADDVTFPTLLAGNTVKAVVLYKDTGVAGSSVLIDYIDDVTGLPLATNGGDVQIQWSNGPYRIFSL